VEFGEHVCSLPIFWRGLRLLWLIAEHTEKDAEGHGENQTPGLKRLCVTCLAIF
jgi:hypothetical protein